MDAEPASTRLHAGSASSAYAMCLAYVANYQPIAEVACSQPCACLCAIDMCSSSVGIWPCSAGYGSMCQQSHALAARYILSPYGFCEQDVSNQCGRGHDAAVHLPSTMTGRSSGMVCTTTPSSSATSTAPAQSLTHHQAHRTPSHPGVPLPRCLTSFAASAKHPHCTVVCMTLLRRLALTRHTWLLQDSACLVLSQALQHQKEFCFAWSRALQLNQASCRLIETSLPGKAP